MKMPWLTGAVLLLACFHTGLSARCHGGWNQWQYSCYLFNTGQSSHTWSDSRQRCVAQDADLLTIDSIQERDFVLGQTNRYLRYVRDWWIGLNALPDGASWQWLSSTNRDISILGGRWASGEPNKTSSKMCVEVKNNRFTVQDCSLTLHAICERAVGKPLTCDPNWKLDSGQCYLYVSSSMDYTGASQYCENAGATLAQVYDMTTQNAVWEQARANSHAVWIGLKSVQQGNGYQWRWPNGTVLSKGYWGTTPPQSLGANVNKTCVEQSLGGVYLQSWNPVLCNTRRPFLCQKPQGTCPSGWLQFTNRCFNIYTSSPRSFSDAQGFCRDLGGNLLALDSGDLVQFLWPYVRDARAAGAESIWIGLTDYNRDNGQWIWVANNKTVSWQNFAPDTTLNTPGKQDCMTIDSTDNALRWRPAASCDSLKTFVCQLPVNKALQHPTQPPKHYSCPEGFNLYQPLRTCVQLNQMDRSWSEARQDCRQQGADLVTFPTGRLYGYVRSQIQAHLGKYWIGLNDRAEEGQYRWLDSTDKPRFLYWHQGQSSNTLDNQNCVAIFPQDNYRWWNADCTTRYNYICQRDAIVNGVTPPPTTQKPWTPQCGPLWDTDPNSDSCYLLVTDRLSWLDARDVCRTHHGDLLAINSVTEQFYINGRVSSLNTNFFWVGANDRQTENGWHWADNSPMAFVNWEPNEPNNQNNSDCAAMSGSDGGWSDFPCTARYGYICEKKAAGATTIGTTRPTTPAHVPSGKVWGCGLGWSGFNGQCYAFRQQHSVSWTSAQTYCGQLGAALASLHSSAENNFASSLIPYYYPRPVWIGLRDVKRVGSFEWSDMSPVTYTPWATRQPDNTNGADCVAMYPSRFWSEFSCNSGLGGFLCKKPMGLQSAADIAMKQGCAHGLGYQARCYVYISRPARTWQSALSDCQRHNGTLATVNNRHVQAFLSAEMLYRGTPYWIGLKNTGPTNKTYMWSSNFTVDFTFWSMNHTGNEVGTCVAMAPGRPLGLWQNLPCARPQAYICELPRVGFTTPPPTTPTTLGRLPCPPDWVTLETLCVKAFNVTRSQRLSWMEARESCQQFQGDLLDISSQDMESQVLTKVFNNAPEGDWWIGLNDRDSENGHVWSDGKGVAYTHWLAGEPNDYNNREDCVLWHFQGGTSNLTQGWRDSNCYLARRYLCAFRRRKHARPTVTTLPPPTSVTSKLCPSNGTWLLLSGQCYFFSPEQGPTASLSWYQARRQCQARQAELVSVHGVDENGFLTTAMSRRQRHRFWLGLNDLSQSGYRWTDGSPVDYVSWDLNQPNDAFGGESCVVSNSQGVWNDKNCMNTNGYICKELPKGVITQRPTLAPVSGGCPRGYTSASFLEKCYMVGGLTNTTRLNFTDAINFCRSQTPSASLLSIHHVLEQNYVTSLIGQSTRPVWIGLNDRQKRNSFRWQDNSEMDFTHWGPGQPDENLNSNDPADRRDCVALNTRRHGAGNWNDLDCRVLNPFICQVHRVPSLRTLQPENTGCRAGYTRQLGRCYKYFDTPKSWSQAQATCAHDGGFLATPHDRFQKNVVGLLRVPDIQHARNISDIWIGLKFQGGFTFQWVDKGPVRYTAWASEEPDNTGDCVKMDSAFFWHDHPCHSTYPFVCQLGDTTPAPTTPAPAKGSCGPEWSSHGQFCYRLLHDSGRTWPGARFACRQLGGSLVSVHSKQEMDWINGLLVAATMATATASQAVSSRANVWLGLSKAADNGFAWSDGTEMEFDYWDQGEPSDSDRGQHQDCVQTSIATGKWNDVDCFNSNFYICKMPQDVTASAQHQAGEAASSSSSLSAGAEAGIAIAAAVIIAVAILAAVLLRSRFLPSAPVPGNGAGRGAGKSFDNALYVKEGQAAGDKDCVTFGAGGDGSES